MLVNLKNTWERRRDHARALLLCDRLVELTDAPEFVRDRGQHALAERVVLAFERVVLAPQCLALHQRRVEGEVVGVGELLPGCLLYTSPSPRDRTNLVCRLLLEKQIKTTNLLAYVSGHTPE